MQLLSELNSVINNIEVKHKKMMTGSFHHYHKTANDDAEIERLLRKMNRDLDKLFAAIKD
jgi:hypothetical protein